jgi:hypothetical protein
MMTGTSGGAAECFPNGALINIIHEEHDGGFRDPAPLSASHPGGFRSARSGLFSWRSGPRE